MYLHPVHETLVRRRTAKDDHVRDMDKGPESVPLRTWKSRCPFREWRSYGRVAVRTRCQLAFTLAARSHLPINHSNPLTVFPSCQKSHLDGIRKASRMTKTSFLRTALRVADRMYQEFEKQEKRDMEQRLRQWHRKKYGGVYSWLNCVVEPEAPTVDGRVETLASDGEPEHLSQAEAGSNAGGTADNGTNANGAPLPTGEMSTAKRGAESALILWVETGNGDAVEEVNDDWDAASGTRVALDTGREAQELADDQWDEERDTRPEGRDTDTTTTRDTAIHQPDRPRRDDQKPKPVETSVYELPVRPKEVRTPIRETVDEDEGDTTLRPKNPHRRHETSDYTSVHHASSTRRPETYGMNRTSRTDARYGDLDRSREKDPRHRRHVESTRLGDKSSKTAPASTRIPRSDTRIRREGDSSRGHESFRHSTIRDHECHQRVTSGRYDRRTEHGYHRRHAADDGTYRDHRRTRSDRPRHTHRDRPETSQRRSDGHQGRRIGRAPTDDHQHRKSSRHHRAEHGTEDSHHSTYHHRTRRRHRRHQLHRTEDNDNPERAREGKHSKHRTRTGADRTSGRHPGRHPRRSERTKDGDTQQRSRREKPETDDRRRRTHRSKGDGSIVEHWTCKVYTVKVPRRRRETLCDLLFGSSRGV